MKILLAVAAILAALSQAHEIDKRQIRPGGRGRKRIQQQPQIDDYAKRVVCYYTNWSVYRQGLAKYTPQNINPYLCTHLVYAFGGLTDEFEVKPFDSYQDIEQGGYAKFNALKQYNKELKTLLAIGGWNEGSGRFSELVSLPEFRKTFIISAIKHLRRYNFDGLDLDWEYPASRDGSAPEDRENYAALVTELKAAFEDEGKKVKKGRLLLTMAVPAGQNYIDKGYDIPSLTRDLDFFNILNYDYHSAYEPTINHHASLMSSPGASEYEWNAQLNVDWTVKYYIELGADKHKLVIGIPTYGRSYTLVDGNFTDFGSAADGPGEQGKYTKENGFMAFYEVCENIASNGWEVKKPFPRRIGPYAFSENQWVGYDDEKIVARKAEYVRENGLGGIMYWSLDNDDFRGICNGEQYPLVEAGKKALFADSDKEANEARDLKNATPSTRTRSRGDTSVASRTQDLERRPGSSRTRNQVPLSVRTAQDTRTRNQGREEQFRTASQPTRTQSTRTRTRGSSRFGESSQAVPTRRPERQRISTSRPSRPFSLLQNPRRPGTTTTTAKPRTTRRPTPTRTTPARFGGTRRPQAGNRRQQATTTFNPLSTPPPPTTPSPVSSFACRREGFYPNPDNCHKYYWCLNSGASGLGIVAHTFTCPSGLVFNKVIDGCDHPDRAKCSTEKKNRGGAGGATTPASTPIPTTTEIPTDYSYYDDYYYYDDYDYEESLPAAEKPVEEVSNTVSRQLQNSGGSQFSQRPTTAEEADSSSTSSSSGGGSLGGRTRPQYTSVQRKRPAASGAPDQQQQRQQQQQEQVVDSSPGGRPQYTTIQRQRPSNQAPSAEEQVAREDTTSGGVGGTRTYVTIDRQRPGSATTDAPEAVFTTESTLEYVTISRSRGRTTPPPPPSTTPSLSSSVFSHSRPSDATTTSRYVTIQRGRPTPSSAPAEEEEIFTTFEEEPTTTAVPVSLTSVRYRPLVVRPPSTTPSPSSPPLNIKENILHDESLSDEPILPLLQADPLPLVHGNTSPLDSSDPKGELLPVDPISQDLSTLTGGSSLSKVDLDLKVDLVPEVTQTREGSILPGHNLIHEVNQVLEATLAPNADLEPGVKVMPHKGRVPQAKLTVQSGTLPKIIPIPVDTIPQAIDIEESDSQDNFPKLIPVPVNSLSHSPGFNRVNNLDAQSGLGATLGGDSAVVSIPRESIPTSHTSRQRGNRVRADTDSSHASNVSRKPVSETKPETVTHTRRVSVDVLKQDHVASSVKTVSETGLILDDQIHSSVSKSETLPETGSVPDIGTELEVHPPSNHQIASGVDPHQKPLTLEISRGRTRLRNDQAIGDRTQVDSAFVSSPRERIPTSHTNRQRGNRIRADTDALRTTNVSRKPVSETKPETVTHTRHVSVDVLQQGHVNMTSSVNTVSETDSSLAGQIHSSVSSLSKGEAFPETDSVSDTRNELEAQPPLEHQIVSGVDPHQKPLTLDISRGHTRSRNNQAIGDRIQGDSAFVSSPQERIPTSHTSRQQGSRIRADTDSSHASNVSRKPVSETKPENITHIRRVNVGVLQQGHEASSAKTVSETDPISDGRIQSEDSPDPEVSSASKSDILTETDTVSDIRNELEVRPPSDHQIVSGADPHQKTLTLEISRGRPRSRKNQAIGDRIQVETDPNPGHENLVDSHLSSGANVQSVGQSEILLGDGQMDSAGKALSDGPPPSPVDNLLGLGAISDSKSVSDGSAASEREHSIRTSHRENIRNSVSVTETEPLLQTVLDSHTPAVTTQTDISSHGGVVTQHNSISFGKVGTEADDVSPSNQQSQDSIKIKVDLPQEPPKESHSLPVVTVVAVEEDDGISVVGNERATGRPSVGDHALSLHPSAGSPHLQMHDNSETFLQAQGEVMHDESVPTRGVILSKDPPFPLMHGEVDPKVVAVHDDVQVGLVETGPRLHVALSPQDVSTAAAAPGVETEHKTIGVINYEDYYYDDLLYDDSALTILDTTTSPSESTPSTTPATPTTDTITTSTTTTTTTSTPTTTTSTPLTITTTDTTATHAPSNTATTGTGHIRVKGQPLSSLSGTRRGEPAAVGVTRPISSSRRRNPIQAIVAGIEDSTLLKETGQSDSIVSRQPSVPRRGSQAGHSPRRRIVVRKRVGVNGSNGQVINYCISVSWWWVCYSECLPA